MKKRALMAFPKLTATEEMKQIAASDTCEESLEDYFKRVTGGEGIA